MSRAAPTSSAELDELLETARQKFTLPAALSRAQRRALFSPKYIDRLRRSPIVLEIDGERTKLEPIPAFGAGAIPSHRRLVESAMARLASPGDWTVALPHLLQGLKFAGLRLREETVLQLIDTAGRQGHVAEVVSAAAKAAATGLTLATPWRSAQVQYWIARAVADGGWGLEEPETEAAAAEEGGDGPAKPVDLLAWGLVQARRTSNLLEEPLHAQARATPDAGADGAAAAAAATAGMPPLPLDPLQLSGPLHMAAVAVTLTSPPRPRDGGDHSRTAADARRWLPFYARKLARRWVLPGDADAAAENGPQGGGGGLRAQYPPAAFADGAGHVRPVAHAGDMHFVARPDGFVQHAALLLHALDAAGRGLDAMAAEAAAAEEEKDGAEAEEGGVETETQAATSSAVAAASRELDAAARRRIGSIAQLVRAEVAEALRGIDADTGAVGQEQEAGGESTGSPGVISRDAGWPVGAATFVRFFGPGSLHYRVTAGASEEARMADELVGRLTGLDLAVGRVEKVYRF